MGRSKGLKTVLPARRRRFWQNGGHNGSETPLFESLLIRLRRYYPLSFFGSVLLLTSLLLLGNGLLFSDIFAFTAGILAFLLCLILSVAVFLQPASRIGQGVRWNSGHDLTAYRCNSSHTAAVTGWEPPLFLRLHLSLRARLQIGTLVLYRFRRDYCLRGSEPRVLEITPPVPGRLQIQGEFYLSDIFGITRRRILSQGKRIAHVLPLGENMGEVDAVRTSQSEDDARPRRISENERIFIRDYQPGDLARDINWKASGRIDKLLTRIAPEAESQSRLIRLMLIADSYLLKLAYLKSLLRGFLDQLRTSDPLAVFNIWLHDRLYEVDNEDGMLSFFKELAAWCPNSSFALSDLPPATVSMTIFSHEDCSLLARSVRRYEGSHLFLVRNYRGGDYDCRLPYFSGEGFIPARLPEKRRRKASERLPEQLDLQEFVLQQGGMVHENDYGRGGNINKRYNMLQQARVTHENDYQPLSSGGGG